MPFLLVNVSVKIGSLQDIERKRRTLKRPCDANSSRTLSHGLRYYIEERDLYDLCIIVSIKIQFVIYGQRVTLRFCRPFVARPMIFSLRIFRLHLLNDIGSMRT